ncbi:cupin domain-containing protein [Ramlibacter sp. WS9]|uniref:cupin domain-containing protein n=1 Tax=Ramlibacter sp. WS9 TaxID=1882741 RepID=UPI00130521F9|nr:cupin domain-containing protein [Ramlibacter sp. WS9]
MQQSTSTSKEQIERRIARYGELPGTTSAFIDSRLPGGQKQNFKLVAAGKGIFENPDMRPAIPVPHNINMSWVLIPPGGGSNLHDHPGSGAELFIPVDGPLTIYWGDDGEQQTTLQKFDCVSIPEGLMRGFRNDGDKPVLMLAIVDGGAAGGGSVRWHQSVLERAAQTGLYLDASGKLAQRVSEGAEK